MLPCGVVLRRDDVRRDAVRRAGHVERAVRPAVRLHRAEVAIRDRERAGERVVVRQVGLVVVADRARAGRIVRGSSSRVLRREPVERAAVDLAVDLVPALGRVVEAVRGLMEARDRARRACVGSGFVASGAAPSTVWPGHGQRREVVIERAVLLHHQHDVIDRECSPASRRRACRSPDRPCRSRSSRDTSPAYPHTMAVAPAKNTPRSSRGRTASRRRA